MGLLAIGLNLRGVFGSDSCYRLSERIQNDAGDDERKVGSTGGSRCVDVRLDRRSEKCTEKLTATSNESDVDERGRRGEKRKESDGYLLVSSVARPETKGHGKTRWPGRDGSRRAGKWGRSVRDGQG